MNVERFNNLEEYKARKQALLKEAFDLKFEGLKFTDDELKANEILVDLCTKTKENLDEKFHFRPILYRDFVESSVLYKLLTDMPKGSQQHSHNSCHLPSKWWIPYSLTPDVYINEQKKIDLFEGEAPEGWKSVKKLREEAANKEEFDKNLADCFHLTLEEYDHPDMWNLFEFKIANRLAISLKQGIWEQYVLDTFILAIEEGYNNMQIRMFLPFYEHPNFMKPAEEVKMYRRCLAKAQEKDPNFTIGITFAALRFWDNEKVKKFLEIAYELSKTNRDIIVGFDLVAEENRRAAEDFAPVFVDHLKKSEAEGFDLPLLLHAGETLDQNNTNVYDAYLVNSKRIGHGLNLFKHPYLLPKIKEQGICVETNPLSNQILKYVADLRLHPAIGYHNSGVKISLNSDDIAIFQLQTIWDFFMAALSFEFNLLDFKRVVINSIETSCMIEEIKEKLLRDWHNKWAQFISKILEKQYV